MRPRLSDHCSGYGLVLVPQRHSIVGWRAGDLSTVWCQSCFAEYQQHITCATRNSRTLDLLYSNIQTDTGRFYLVILPPPITAYYMNLLFRSVTASSTENQNKKNLKEATFLSRISKQEELISAGKTSHEDDKKDLSHYCEDVRLVEFMCLVFTYLLACQV